MSGTKPSQEEERFVAEQEVARRKTAEREKALEDLHDREIEGVLRVLHIDDRELAAHLVDLGFGADTVEVFPLIPLVYVAWADGAVTSRERDRVLELASQRGMKEDSASYRFLQDLLERRPVDGFLDTAVHAIRRIFDAMPTGAADDAKRDLVSLSISIAQTSGGFLGLFGDKISDEERRIITEIADELGLRENKAAAELLGRL